MWRLVKAELDYFEYPSILGYGIIVLLFLLHVAFVVFVYAEVNYIFQNGLLLVFSVILFTHLIFEVKEKRARTFMVLPVSLWQVGMVRIVTPLIFFLTFAVVSTFCMLIVIPLEYKLLTSTVFDEAKYILLPIFTLFIAATYYTRLLSEWQGRVLIGALFLLAILSPLIPLIWPGQYTYADLLKSAFNLDIGIGTLPYVLLGLPVFLFFSFIRRRSFLL